MAKKPRFIEFFCLFKHIYHGVWDFHLFSQFSPRWKCLEKDKPIVYQMHVMKTNNYLQLETKILYFTLE
jgi:hypothetical protein